MEYLSSVSSLKDKLELLNKRILRFIFNDLNSSYDELLKKAKTNSSYDELLKKAKSQPSSGFGEALSSVAFGSSFVIDSEDPAIWTLAIQNIWSTDRECRLEEALTLRDNYARKYNWAKQIKELVDRMISLAHGRNVDYLFFNGALSGNDRKTDKNTISYKFCPEILKKMFANTYLHADIRKTVTFVISSGILFSAEWSVEGGRQNNWS